MSPDTALEAENARLRTALATAQQRCADLKLAMGEEYGWFDRFTAERLAHAETRKALEDELRAGMTAHEHRTLLAALTEAKAALADIHKLTGRGEGHGSPKATADCVISAWMSRGMALDESEAELAKAEAKIAAVRKVTAWSPCEVDADDEDGPVFQGFLTDEGGTWVKVSDLVEALRG